MGLIKNAINFGNGFNIGAVGPIDSRMRVETLSDLTSVWGASTPAYLGMIVTVMDTLDVYVLTDQDKWNESKSWVKLAKSADVKGDAEALQAEFDAHVQENITSFANVDNRIKPLESALAGVESGETVVDLISNAEVSAKNSSIAYTNEKIGEVPSGSTVVSMIAKAQEDAEAHADELKVETDAAIAKAQEDAEAHADELKAETDAAIAQAKEDAVAHADELKAETDAAIAKAKEDAVAHADELKAETDAAIAQAKEDAVAHADGLKVETDAAIAQAQEDAEAHADELKAETDAALAEVVSRVSNVENTYATKQELQAETERATAKENEIVSGLTAVTTKVNTFFENADIAQDAIDTLIELQDYITQDKSGAASMQEAIANNSTNIATVSGQVQTAKSELKAEIATKVAEVSSELTTYKASNDTRVLKVETDLSTLSSKQNSDVDALNAAIAKAKEDAVAHADGLKVETDAAIAKAKEDAVAHADELKVETDAAIAKAKEDAVAHADELKAETDAAIAKAKEDAEAHADELKAETDAELAEVVSRVSNVENTYATKQELSDAVEPLATKDELSSAVASLEQIISENERTIAESLVDLDSTKADITYVDSEISDAVAPLATKDELSSAVAPLATKDSVTSATNRISALEGVTVNGSNAINVSATSALSNKVISLLLKAYTENAGGIKLSQDGNGLSASMQWGEF